MPEQPIQPEKNFEPGDPICPPNTPTFPRNPGQHGPEAPDLGPAPPDISPPSGQPSGCPTGEHASSTSRWFLARPLDAYADQLARTYAEQIRKKEQLHVCSKGTCGAINGACEAVAYYCATVKKAFPFGYRLEIKVKSVCKCKGLSSGQQSVIKDCTKF